MENAAWLSWLGGAWCLLWSNCSWMKPHDFISPRRAGISDFLHLVSGNTDWSCPVCGTKQTNMDHLLAKWHIKKVWRSLDKAMGMHGLEAGTYTELAFPFAKAWAFKPCQPARGLPATCPFSLVDGTAYLLAYGHKDQLIDDRGFVNFLPGGCAPARDPPACVSHTHFQQLALADGAVCLSSPMRAG